MKKLALILILVATVITSYAIAIAERAEAQANPETKVNITVQLSDNLTTVDLRFNIRNQTDDQVITSYKFPDLWDSSRLTSVVNSSSRSSNVRLSAGVVNIDMTNQPLRPGESQQVAMKLVSNREKEVIKSFNAIELDLANSNTSVTSYRVLYPQTWGSHSYINLKSDSYELSESDSNYLLKLQATPQIEVKWGREISGRITFNKTVDSDSLIVLPRQNNKQLLYFNNSDLLESIYKDESDNVFTQFKQQRAENDERQVYIDYYVDLATGNDISETNTNDLLQGENQVVTYSRYQLPSELQLLLDEIEEKQLTEADLISETISQLSRRYDVRAINLRQFANDVEVISNDQSSISYYQYLLAINEMLHQLGIENKIVMVDTQPGAQQFSFWLETCDVGGCRYYSTEVGLRNYEQRRMSGLALQLVGFDGINNLAFAKIRNIESELFSNAKFEPSAQSVLGANANGESENNVIIQLNLPEKTQAFSDFSISAEINNLSNEPIFLDAIVIANNTFPIIDDSLGGVHEGVLPGQTKTFTIDNVFLPRYFLAPEERSNFQLDVWYEKSSQQYVFNSEHSILLQQNYLFTSLLALGVFSILTSIVTTIMIYQHNKYLFISAFWRTRRRISSGMWEVTRKLPNIRRR
jgi:hypothetical protein